MEKDLGNLDSKLCLKITRSNEIIRFVEKKIEDFSKPD